MPPTTRLAGIHGYGNDGERAGGGGLVLLSVDLVSGRRHRIGAVAAGP